MIASEGWITTTSTVSGSAWVKIQSSPREARLSMTVGTGAHTSYPAKRARRTSKENRATLAAVIAPKEARAR